jgi:hypothetical protein
MYSHGHYASKLKALMGSISDWSLATAEQRARAKFLSEMMKLASKGDDDE